MYRIVDFEKNCTPVKSGFKTGTQADKWAKKNLPKDSVLLWGVKPDPEKNYRYAVWMK